MTDSIDLDVLARRENEQTEWKENVADVEQVVATLSAFANDLQNLGGGYVVCGAAEDTDEHGFPVLRRTGLTAARLKEVEGRVLSLCRSKVSPPITPLVEEILTDDPQRRILVFVHLEQAERDLRAALTLSVEAHLTEQINRNISFLARLRRNNQPPQRRAARGRRG